MTGLSDSWRFAVTRDERGNPRTIRLGDEEIKLQSAPVTVRRDDGQELELSDAMVARGLAVLRQDDDLFVLHLDDSRRVFGRASLVYAFDPTLPGYPGPDPDPPVTYECPNGDIVTQPASNPNRKCRVCGEPLSPA